MICYETTKKYCNEDISLIENYEEAVNNSEKYDCHHRLEIQDGKKVYSVKQLKELNLYYKRPAEELIFLSHVEHVRLHGKIEVHKSHTPFNKGLKYFNNGIKEIFADSCPKGFIPGRLPRSKEWNKKISDTHKTLKPITEETRQKLRDSHLGYKLKSETKEKLRESSAGRRFYNNGVINVFVRECPKGFVKGKLMKKR